ncbi:CLUMA_CG013599, isoform A [Clunio marinus]|uniref:CLUMA_CG013599, isoform A n=1 Tax=Clunio marinus TaxID=568069 RepID=A0A1J1IML1_9DIPT|nr:CLUMA_CG013599, isoform A [Clunio marinus]
METKRKQHTGIHEMFQDDNPNKSFCIALSEQRRERDCCTVCVMIVIIRKFKSEEGYLTANIQGEERKKSQLKCRFGHMVRLSVATNVVSEKACVQIYDGPFRDDPIKFKMSFRFLKHLMGVCSVEYFARIRPPDGLVLECYEES